MTQKIAWLTNDKIYIETFVFEMEQLGFENIHHRHATSAIDDFTTGTKYSLIVINPDIAPGLDYKDPVISEIMKTHQGSRPNYWEIALRVIELTKQENSTNKNTPICMIGNYQENNDRLWPNARQACLNAGAKDYFNLINLSERKIKLYEELERLIREQ